MSLPLNDARRRFALRNVETGDLRPVDAETLEELVVVLPGGHLLALAIVGDRLEIHAPGANQAIRPIASNTISVGVERR
jgi:hypothetical protein